MAKLKNKISYLVALLAPFVTLSVTAQEEPKSAGSDQLLQALHLDLLAQEL